MRLYEVEIELDEVVFVELCHLFHRCHFFLAAFAFGNHLS